MHSWYEYQLKHPFVVIAGAIATLIMSASLMRFVGNEFSPSTDASEITITARTPMGSLYAKSESVAKEIEDVLTQFPEVKSTTVKIGDKGLQNIDVRVKLVDTSERKLSDKKYCHICLKLKTQKSKFVLVKI